MEPDPATVRGYLEFGHRDRRVTAQPGRTPRFDVHRPEARYRRLRIADVHGELLFHALFFVDVDRVGRDEVDLLTVGSDRPQADAGRLARELLRLRRVDSRDRKGIQLLLAGLSAAIHEPPAVIAECV